MKPFDIVVVVLFYDLKKLQVQKHPSFGDISIQLYKEFGKIEIYQKNHIFLNYEEIFSENTFQLFRNLFWDSSTFFFTSLFLIYVLCRVPCVKQVNSSLHKQSLISQNVSVCVCVSVD